jgi:hypothetical protein
MGCVVQQWMRDRDLLVEEALAFAKSVAAAKPVRIETVTLVAPPKAVETAQLPKARNTLFERDQIRERVAHFKATQCKFEIEREEYFDKTMWSVRSKFFSQQGLKPRLRPAFPLVIIRTRRLCNLRWG